MDESLLQCEALSALAAFVRQGSLKGAATTLRASNPVVKRRLQRLEQWAGGPVFVGEKGRVRLTLLGKMLLKRADPILAELEAIRQDAIQTARKPPGTVRLGILSSLFHDFGRRLLELMSQRHPEIQIRLMSASSNVLEGWLLSGYIDLALRFDSLEAGSREGKVIGVKSTYLIGPPGDALTSRPTVPFAALRNLPLVLPSRPHNLRVQLDRCAKHRGFALTPVLELNSVPVLREIVAGGGCYTILAECAIGHGMVEHQLQWSLLVNPEVKRNLILATAKKASLTSSAKAVVKTLLNHRKLLDSL